MTHIYVRSFLLQDLTFAQFEQWYQYVYRGKHECIDWIPPVSDRRDQLLRMNVRCSTCEAGINIDELGNCTCLQFHDTTVETSYDLVTKYGIHEDVIGRLRRWTMNVHRRLNRKKKSNHHSKRTNKRGNKVSNRVSPSTSLSTKMKVVVTRPNNTDSS